MMRFLLPAGVFAGLVALLWVGLGLNPRELPSPLIGKPAPAFERPTLADPSRTLSTEDMKGKVWLLNVWASWCASCRVEHPLFVELSRQGIVPIVGLNYKDQREDALAWLQQFGNPYAVVVTDEDGKVGIDYGVYGVPETYLIDRDGIVRYKQVGPVTREVLRDKILPLIEELKG